MHGGCGGRHLQVAVGPLAAGTVVRLEAWWGGAGDAIEAIRVTYASGDEKVRGGGLGGVHATC